MVLEIQFKIPIINDKRTVVDKEGMRTTWKIRNRKDNLLLESCGMFGRQYLKKNSNSGKGRKYEERYDSNYGGSRYTIHSKSFCNC